MTKGYYEVNNAATNCKPKPIVTITKPTMATIGLLSLSLIEPIRKSCELRLIALTANMAAPRKVKPNPVVSSINCM